MAICKSFIIIHHCSSLFIPVEKSHGWCAKQRVCAPNTQLSFSTGMNSDEQ